MAVAVKNAPGAASASASDRPVVVSLLGVLYVVGSLGIIFKGLPLLVEQLGVPTHNLLGGLLLGVLMLAATVVLAYLGVKLLGPTQVRGVRAGLFVALVLFLVALGLARWASLWLEYWVFNLHWMGENGRLVGAIVSGAVFVGILGLGAWAFNHVWTQKQVIHLEEAGWFHASSYKPLQGVRVRRGTLAALVVVAAAGVWTLVSHGTLKRGAPDWSVYVPFTGTVAIESVGDTQEWIQELDARKKAEVEVRYPGDTGYRVKHDVPVESYRAALRTALATPGMAEDTRTAVTANLDGEPLQLTQAVNHQLREHLRAFIEHTPPAFFKAEVKKALLDLAGRTDDVDATPLVVETQKQVKAAREAVERNPARLEEMMTAMKEPLEEVDALFKLPTAVLVLDRYDLRNVNERADPNQYVRVGLTEVAGLTKADGTPIKEGEVIPTKELKEAITRLQNEALKPIESFRDNDPEKFEERRRAILESLKLPKEETLAPATGPTHFGILAQLPSVQYTVPLLILAASFWLAWRMVNMPAFADFLIATEAELNKVSWTTQRRLMQDTVVVLATVILMAGYLFGVDQLWRVALSTVSVLQIPKEQSDKNRALEQKNW